MAAKKKTKPRIQIDLARVTELASRGLSQEQIAAALGISVGTVENRNRENGEFKAALEKGRAEGIETVANALFENAKSGNVTAQIFFLKAQAKWKDKPEEDDGDTEKAQPVRVEVTVTDSRKPSADS